MKAFVLCKLTPGAEQKALRRIRTIPGVSDVYLTLGQWDVILTADAATLDKLSGLVVREIRSAEGVQATETLVTTGL